MSTLLGVHARAQYDKTDDAAATSVLDTVIASRTSSAARVAPRSPGVSAAQHVYQRDRMSVVHSGWPVRRWLPCCDCRDFQADSGRK